MSSHRRVSVIIPLLPEHRFSKESLESLARQSFQDFDILFVDGGASTGFISKLIEQANCLGLSCQWIHDHRENISVLRNRGVMESRAEYVAFHNYPDLMMISRIEEGVSLLDRRSDLVLASSPVEILEPVQEESPRSSPPSRHFQPWFESEKILEKLLKRTFPLPGRRGLYHIPEATTLTVRRAAILAAGLYDTRFSVTPWATVELSVRLYLQGPFGRIGTPLVQKVFRSNTMTPEIWSRSMEQMDLFYLILSWRTGATPDRETEQLLRIFRTRWLRYWSGWFFRYRTGRTLGIALALRALLGNFLCLENWKWTLKSFFPQSHYPRLFWFERFIDAPVPSHLTRPGIGQILSSNWRLPCP